MQPTCFGRSECFYGGARQPDFCSPVFPPTLPATSHASPSMSAPGGETAYRGACAREVRWLYGAGLVCVPEFAESWLPCLAEKRIYFLLCKPSSTLRATVFRVPMLPHRVRSLR